METCGALTEFIHDIQYFLGYRRIGNWWENGDVDRGMFSGGWGLTGPRPVDLESPDTLN